MYDWGSSKTKNLMKNTLIIAEAGVNHNGDIDLAKKLIDSAAAAGVDYVKFQTFNAKKLVSKNAQSIKKTIHQGLLILNFKCFKN